MADLDRGWKGVFRFSSLLLVFFAFLWAKPVHGRAQDVNQEGAPASETVVRQLYDLVTFPSGTTPDWDQVRSLFLPEAVVVLRTTRTATSVFTVEDFIQDWLRFIRESQVEDTGFTERIVRTHTTEMGDIAHVWVLYEAEIPGWGRPPQPGVDGFHLVQRDGRWKIASIVNEVPGPDRAIPDMLSGGE